MEIELYSKQQQINAELIHNTTRRERTPVSRTSDANFSMRAADCGCQLIDDYHCLSLMRFDHTRITFDEALKHISYRTYYGWEISSALYLNIVDNPDEALPVELYNDLHIAIGLEFVFPYVTSYDGKSYDVYKLFIESLNTIDLSTINPDTYFYYEILPNSGLTEITYDCSPKKYKYIVNSVIRFSHVDQIIAPRIIRNKVTSQITLVEKLVKG